MINKALKTGAAVAMGSQVLLSDVRTHKLNPDAPAHQQAVSSLAQSGSEVQAQEKQKFFGQLGAAIGNWFKHMGSGGDDDKPAEGENKEEEKKESAAEKPKEEPPKE